MMEALLEVKGLTKKYDKNTVVNDLNFRICEGEIVGLVGANGVGKTTTMKMITGLIHKDAGEVLFQGKSIFDNFEQYIQEVGVVIETPTFYPYLTGKENLDFAGRFYKNCNSAECRKIMELFHMEPYINKKVSKYSLGMKQRLGICRAFLNHPKMIILDEPTNGLDVDGAIKFRREVRNVAKEQGVTFLISSHNLLEIEEICDRIFFMTDGKVEEINKETIKSENHKYCIRTNDVDGIEEIFKNSSKVVIVNRGSDWIEIEDMNERGDLLSKVLQSNITVYEWSKIEDDLQSYYLSKNENAAGEQE